MINPISNNSFEINLNPKENDLISRVSSLETYIAEQNKKILNLEEKVKNFEKIIVGNEKEKKEKKNELFSETEILYKEEMDMIINCLPRKPNKITLLMNSNIDGDSTKTFMDKCNGKCPTLAVIKTTNGYVFGGYTTQMWKNGEVKDNNAFVFSIDKKKKYNIKQPEHAIGFSENNCWLFGYGYNAIYIYDKCKTRNDNYVDNKTYDIKEQYELNGGEKNFTVKSFEIFQVEY
jgi:hypothetical protein